MDVNGKHHFCSGISWCAASGYDNKVGIIRTFLCAFFMLSSGSWRTTTMAQDTSAGIISLQNASVM